MGALCFTPMSIPDNIGVDVIAAVAGGPVCVIRDGTLICKSGANGTLFLSRTHLVYFTAGAFGGKIIDFPVQLIQECKQVSVFRDKRVYMKPCSCCSGCPDGFVDLTLTVEGAHYHVGVAVVDSEEFVDKILKAISVNRMNRDEKNNNQS